MQRGVRRRGSIIDEHRPRRTVNRSQLDSICPYAPSKPSEIEFVYRLNPDGAQADQVRRRGHGREHAALRSAERMPPKLLWPTGEFHGGAASGHRRLLVDFSCKDFCLRKEGTHGYPKMSILQKHSPSPRLR